MTVAMIIGDLVRMMVIAIVTMMMIGDMIVTMMIGDIDSCDSDISHETKKTVVTSLRQLLREHHSYS